MMQFQIATILLLGSCAASDLTTADINSLADIKFTEKTPSEALKAAKAVELRAIEKDTPPKDVLLSSLLLTAQTNDVKESQNALELFESSFKSFQTWQTEERSHQEQGDEMIAVFDEEYVNGGEEVQKRAFANFTVDLMKLLSKWQYLKKKVLTKEQFFIGRFFYHILLQLRAFESDTILSTDSIQFKGVQAAKKELEDAEKSPDKGIPECELSSWNSPMRVIVLIVYAGSIVCFDVYMHSSVTESWKFTMDLLIQVVISTFCVGVFWMYYLDAINTAKNCPKSEVLKAEMEDVKLRALRKRFEIYERIYYIGHKGRREQSIHTYSDHAFWIIILLAIIIITTRCWIDESLILGPEDLDTYRWIHIIADVLGPLLIWWILKERIEADTKDIMQEYRKRNIPKLREHLEASENFLNNRADEVLKSLQI